MTAEEIVNTYYAELKHLSYQGVKSWLEKHDFDVTLTFAVFSILCDRRVILE